IKAKGFETYFLDVAKDNNAKATEELENASLNFEIQETSGGIAPINDIFRDMELNVFRNQSSDLAAILEKEISIGQNYLLKRNTGVNQANFYVLRFVEMPSVLIETAFISNPQENKIIKKSSFQEKIAECIYNGINNYLKVINKQK
ncbi:MAG: N-acetylmuramoyl-L-alanine amidase, partial [bacterium]